MGAYVERNGKSYYKADNGKLYQDYKAAESANMNPIARVTRFAKEKIREVGNQGAIPIPSGNNTGYAALGYVKSLAGVSGMPFAIQSNSETDKFLQQTVDASTKTKDTVTFNQDISDKDEYDRLGKDLGNKAFGRYQGSVQDNGDVMVQDDYDTNRNRKWHTERMLSGKDAEGNELGLRSRAISGVSAVHKTFENAGLTNARPYGTEVKVGNVNGGKFKRPDSKQPNPTPDSPNYAAAAIKPTAPAKTSSYSVKSGDTLSSIAARRGMSVADIAKKNNIQNINQINIGQSLTF